MKTKLLVLGLAICMFTTPAKADIFGFTMANLSNSYDGTNTFVATEWLNTTGDLYRNLAPSGTASFDSGSWYVGSEALTVNMTLTSITAISADGSGTLSLADINGDTLTANVVGKWTGTSGIPIFIGTLGNVLFTSGDNTFDGHSGDSVSMLFSSPQPWFGTIVQLTTSGSWFTSGAYGDFWGGTAVHGGSMDVGIVPVPAAVLLGILGLGVAGLKLRKFT